MADDFGGGIHNALDKSNFPSADVLSYSYADPYPSEAAAGKGYKLVQGIDPTFAVVADMNPGSPDLLGLTVRSSAVEMRKGNSANHSGDGQNALYGDGHVEFQNNPFCGTNRDNIYTYGTSGMESNTQFPIKSGGTGIVGSPVGPEDSVLLPAVIMTVATAFAPATDAAAGGPATPVAVAPVDQGTDLTTYLAIASLIFLLVLLGAVAAVVISRRRRGIQRNG
jgi:prepilin-type processing-associated H-X9-DG protein